MRLELPQDIQTRSRLVGAVTAMVAFFVICALLIPNMESALVFITIFALSGIAGALSSAVVRYRARKKMSGISGPRWTVALTILAWIAIILAAYAVLVILNTFFLVPDDPSRTATENVYTKLKIMGAFAVALAGLIMLGRWSFAKRTEIRKTNRRDNSD